MDDACTGGFSCREVLETVSCWGGKVKNPDGSKKPIGKQDVLLSGCVWGGNNGTRFTLQEKLKPVPPSGQLIIPRYGESTVSCKPFQGHARARPPPPLRAKHGALTHGPAPAEMTLFS